MQVFQTPWFEHYAKKARLSDKQLCEAVSRAVRGLVDAQLGGGLIKQRIARPGGGRSGGYRTVIALRTGDRAIFLFGFAKSERDNISDDDLRDLKNTAAILLALKTSGIGQAKKLGQMKEIMCDD